MTFNFNVSCVTAESIKNPPSCFNFEIKGITPIGQKEVTYIRLVSSDNKLLVSSDNLILLAKE